MKQAAAIPQQPVEITFRMDLPPAGRSSPSNGIVAGNMSDRKVGRTSIGSTSTGCNRDSPAACRRSNSSGCLSLANQLSIFSPFLNLTLQDGHSPSVTIATAQSTHFFAIAEAVSRVSCAADAASKLS